MNMDFRIELSLLATERGGRKSELLAGEFRTVIGHKNNYHSALIHIPHALTPGGPPAQCEVKLLDRSHALPHFPEGSTFDVWEGGIKGHGRVLVIHAS